VQCLHGGQALKANCSVFLSVLADRVVTPPEYLHPLGRRGGSVGFDAVVLVPPSFQVPFLVNLFFFFYDTVVPS
jgi:hypothetical protein